MFRLIQKSPRGTRDLLFVLAIVMGQLFAERASATPPLPASSPQPADNATGVKPHVTLSWQAIDPDDDPLTFDVYFGTTPSPEILVTDLDSPSYALTDLDFGAQYYWKVVSRDTAGAESVSPVWTFSTRAGNQAPTVPSGPSPSDFAANVFFGVANATWQCTDPDGDVIQYDVYFGTSSPPPLVKSAASSRSYNASGSLAASTTYYWQVVARDEFDAETTGPVWRFTTKTDAAPGQPTAPLPSIAAPDVATSVTLKWAGHDNDFELLTYDVYFGTDPSPPLVATNISGYGDNQSYTPSTLANYTYYYWKVVTRDGAGKTSTGPTWWFRTVAAPLPVAFSRFGADARAKGIDVRWELHSDEAMESYSLYRRDNGASQAIAIAGGAVTATSGSFLDRNVEHGKTYQYEMLVRTANGDEFRSQRIAAAMPALMLALGQNYPNPFNPTTIIPYSVPPAGAPMHVRLSIYDASGRMVRALVNEDQAGGSREVIWNGSDDRGTVVSSGIYFCVLQVGKEHRTQKVVLLK